MVEGGGGAGFLVESAKMVWIGAGGGTNELEGYLPVESFVTGAEDFAHASFTDFFEDPVMPH